MRGPVHLSPRERQIVLLLATEGLTNVDLAKRVGCGTATIKQRLFRLLTRTETQNRIELVIWAWTNGIVRGDNDYESGRGDSLCEGAQEVEAGAVSGLLSQGSD